MKPESYFDENLRDIPVNIEATKAYVDNLKDSLMDTVEPRERG